MNDFDPEKVDRRIQRVRGIEQEWEFDYVFAADYDQLLTLYKEVAQSLHIHQIVMLRAVAEGYDEESGGVRWAGREITRILAEPPEAKPKPKTYS